MGASRLALVGIGVPLACLWTGISALAQEAPDSGSSSWLQPIPAGSNGVPGTIYERWDGIKGDSISHLTRSNDFRGAADAEGVVQSLELPASEAAQGWIRLRGCLVAPRSGSMQLALSAPGSAELWLSPGKDPFARRRAAWLGRGGTEGTGDAAASRQQRAMPVEVEEGKEYYFEAYFQGGGDACSIKWRFDDESRVSSIPTSALRALLPVAGDGNDDGLPDGWQTETGVATTEEPDSWGDPDGDGVANFDEFVAGSDPLDGGETKGFLLWESWHGIEGANVADLIRSQAFHGIPDRVEYLHGAETPSTQSGIYGSRLSGYIVPTESGSYELAITGDDSAELWLSDGTSSLRKERIAFNDRWRKRGQWNAVPAQVSKPMSLQAGQAYFVEILHKDSSNPGWVAMGWRQTGAENFSAVPPSCLRSPAQQGALGREEVSARLASNPRFAASGDWDYDAAATSEHADPDRDGISNLQELRQGTNPLQPDKLDGALTREWWLDKPGQSLSLSRADASFLRPPSMTTFLDANEESNATTDWFASRLRGSITAPVAGSYRFWISGDDHCELWLSSDDRKFRKKLIAEVSPEDWERPDGAAWTQPLDWDSSRRQESAPVQLEEGRKYFIEILHKDGNGEDHVAVAWQHRETGAAVWSERSIVESSAIASHVGDPDDLDDDYLPDSWESQYGLDPEDNGLTDRARQGEDGDYDADRLSNREEFMLGTNPCLPDTDGDGAGDHDEVKLYESDPNARDASPPVLHADLPLDGFIATAGDWQFDSSGVLTSISRRGPVAFEFETQAAGIYLVELKAGAISSSSYVPPVPLIVSVDGKEIGRGEAIAGGSNFSWMTPWLDPGSHRVVIDNRNVRIDARLAISSVKLLRIAGEDINGNGLPDWMEKFFRDGSSLDRAAEEMFSSFVSPACVEGFSRLPGEVRLSANGTAVVAARGIENRWYANIPLEVSSTTAFKAEFEGGAIAQTLNVNWEALDPLSASEQVEVRVGDRLKLVVPSSGAANGEASCRITVDGSEIYSGPVGNPAVAPFDSAGEHVVETFVTGAGRNSVHSFTVVAYSADFGPRFDLAAGHARTWRLPEVHRALSPDQELALSLDNAGQPLSGKRFRAIWTSGKVGSTNVLARLSPGGPVVAGTSVNVFRLIDAAESGDAHVVKVLPDGTRVVELAYFIDGEIPADFSFWIDLYVTDAVFVDGSSRYQLTADDFDEDGMARVKIYKAPGDGMAYVCHWNRLFEEDGEEENATGGEAGE